MLNEFSNKASYSSLLTMLLLFIPCQMPNTNTKAIRFNFHTNKSVWSWKLHDSYNK
jgi:hypothetical protein